MPVSRSGETFCAPIWADSQKSNPRERRRKTDSIEKLGTVVSRRVYPEVPRKVEYSLTKDGTALLPSLRELQSWAAARKATPAIRKSRSLCKTGVQFTLTEIESISIPPLIEIGLEPIS